MATITCKGSTVSEILEIAGYDIDPPTNIESVEFTSSGPTDGSYNKSATSPDLQFLGAVGKNPRYLNELRIKIGGISSKWIKSKLRVPRQSYNPKTGKYQSFPPISSSTTTGNTEVFLNFADILAALVFNRVIPKGRDLGVRPIDPYTGEFCSDDEVSAKAIVASELGFPNIGNITLATRKTNVNRFGYTFTAVDMEVSAVFGDKVTEVKGLNTLSWSIHADKNADRRLHERTANTRTMGGQTIAGTLIFTMFDEDPVRAMSPIQFFHGHMPIADSSGMSGFNENLPTEIPSFDLFITLTNEYGATSSMVIWGVDITDSGGMLSMRQLENEIAVQYVGMSMEPLKQVEPGPDGNIDFLTSEGIESFQKKRRFAMYKDIASENFEEMYERTMDNIVKEVSLAQNPYQKKG